MRRIDADGLTEILRAKIDVLTIGEPDNPYARCLDNVRKIVNKMPTIPESNDQRVHAHWVHKHRHHGGFRHYTGIDQYGKEHTIECDMRWEEDQPFCSNCGRAAEENDPPYCQWCGARMVEEIENG